MTAPFYTRGPRGASIDSITAEGDDLVIGRTQDDGPSLPDLRVPVPAISDASAAAEAAESARDRAEAARDIAEDAGTAASTDALAAAGSALSASSHAADADDARAAAQLARAGAEDARDLAGGSASAASGSASAAQVSAESASDDEALAAGSASDAEAAALAAAGSASTAAGHAGAAGTARAGAESARDGAQSARTDALAAQSNAETARDVAGGHASSAASDRSLAQTARADAQEAASAAEQSAIDAASVVVDGVPNAAPTVKGGIRLAGDLAGTWDAPTVPALGGKADLVGGKLDSAQLPDLAVSEFLGEAASQSAMLALAGQKGDWCARTDTETTWIIVGDDPSILAGWRQQTYPGAPVSSVAGKTGAVTLVKGDVGLANVNNTSDANKPVSNAQQSALDAKAPTTRTIAAGAGLTGGGDLTANRTLSVDFGTAAGTVCQGDDSRLSNARTPTTHNHSGTQITEGTLPVTAADGSWAPAMSAVAEAALGARTRADVGVVMFGDDQSRKVGVSSAWRWPCDATIVGIQVVGDTADASGSTSTRLLNNGSAVGVSVSAAAANQVAGVRAGGMSVNVSRGDRGRCEITAVGATPGKGWTVIVEAVAR